MARVRVKQARDTGYNILMKRRFLGSLFVLLMLGFAGAVLVRWRSESQVGAVPPTFPAGSAPIAADPGPLGWHPASRLQTKTVDAVILGQLEAFRSGDFAKAALYQAPGLRDKFQNPAGFRVMMLEGYPEFCHFIKVSFGPCVVRAGGMDAMADVTLVDSAGRTTRAQYLMELVRGAYHVGGVTTPPL
jgi:hypothetical protein